MENAAAGPQAAAVACPVCTLYLREGISLQRHLDTHPKEQVIEALIKASSSGVTTQQQSQQQQTQVPLSSPSMQPLQPAPQLSQGAPYPIGPIFECPAIGAVMPPAAAQFASFSYQQFVNNGTVMIPQYAMPQPSQMMQMLYNPYVYQQQQQQPTTVQMLSPMGASALPSTTRLRPGGPSTAEPRPTITVPISSSEPKQILPEIVESEPEPHEATSIEPPPRPVEPVDQQPPCTIQPQFEGVALCSVETTDKIETVLPDIDVSACEKSMETTECRELGFKSPERQEYIVPNEVSVTTTGHHDTEDKSQVQNTNETEATTPREQPQPEVEQLERLLITIMETEFDGSTKKDPSHNNNEQEEAHEEAIEIEPEKDDLDIGKMVCEPSIDESVEPVKSNTADESDHYVYRYKQSLSAPSSPAGHKPSFRRYSLRSELGSIDHLNMYSLGFDTSVFQDEEDEDEDDEDEEDDEEEEDEDEELDDDLEKHEVMDDADLELQGLPSPHTPVMRRGERSHTPLSASSGISVLRVRKDLSKPCSPASVHSFCHIDSNQDNQSDANNSREVASPDGISTDHKNSQEDEEMYDDCKPDYHPRSVIIENCQPSTDCTKRESVADVIDSLEAPASGESTDARTVHYSSRSTQKQSSEPLALNEDAHPGPMSVFEFEGLQILVPGGTFAGETVQKPLVCSASSQQSIASGSEGGLALDEEVKSVSMRADETMPPRGELSEQESNGCTEQSAWQLYMGQESSRMSTSYDLMARESWEESEGSDNEASNPLLDSRSLATHFTSSLFLEYRERGSPTKRVFKCYHCPEVFDCPKERRVHSTTLHKEPLPGSSRDQQDQPPEVKDIKLLDGRVNIFEDIFVPGLHVQQLYQQPLLHQLQPAQSSDLAKLEPDRKIEGLVIQSSDEHFSCPVCGQRFASEKSLQLHHRRVHVAESAKRVRENAKCQICNKEFSSVALFNEHLKVHPLECGQCGKYFFRKQNFKLHMKRHLGIKPFPCTVCDKAFLTKQKLDEHTNGHTGNAPVKCNLCNETFRRYSNLTQHKNRHHLNIKKKLKDYICHCGEVFHTKKKLAWHKETHDEKPKACSYCNERFIHMASLTRHMRRAHNRRFVPDAQRESENVECPICKCIYLKSSLAVHMRVHNGERPYGCQVCSKAFSTKWNLQLHKWTHAARSSKPFKCTQCSAAFYRHSDYTAHMNSHKNVRPYTCNYCGAQFIRKYNCLRHVKEHEENKAYTCDVCSKTFHRSYYLKEHLRVHSGARPYTCHICGKSSGTKSNHNKHVRIHHAREPVNTEN